MAATLTTLEPVSSLVENERRHPIAMGEVQVLDNYYLAITLLITIGYQLFFFSIAFSLKFDKLTGMFSDP